MTKLAGHEVRARWRWLVVAVAVACCAPACGGDGSTSDNPTTTGTGATGAGGSGGTGATGAGGSGATGAGGSGAAPGGPVAADLVNAGEQATSANYRLVFTFGQSTQNQGKTTSPNYRIQGGLIGAQGSLP